jgi:hypothetical protein
MPISSIAIMARGLTRVAFVPAENASKQSPDKCLSSPSAICLLAELWVHRNRTLLFFCGASAATGHAPLFGAGEQDSKLLRLATLNFVENFSAAALELFLLWLLSHTKNAQQRRIRAWLIV